MKHFFLSLLCLFVITEIRSQSKHKIKLTSEHKLIKDSKVFLIPPPNFRLLSHSWGYGSNETGASISVFQSQKSFSSIKRHLSDSYFRSKDYNIVEKKCYKINKMSACWYELVSYFYDRTTIKYILIIGNKHEHAMIEAYCPKEYQLANLAVRKSLFSVYYDRDSVHIKNYKEIPN